MKNTVVTNSELELLKLLWETSPLTAPELAERAAASCGWDASTVKTLLARLVGKGAVRQCGRKRFYFYRPLLSREEYREAAGERLAAQAFDYDCAAMVSFFVRRGKLSAADIAELKRLLDEQETENE